MKAESSFIGIDYHKRYSVFCVLDAQGEVLERGRIDHLYRSSLLRWWGDGQGVVWFLKPA